MVENFEDHTQPLSDDDQAIMATFLAGINLRTKSNPIKSAEIISAINQRISDPKKKLTGARLRKIVNYIRVNGISPVIATSNGYFVSDDEEIIESQIRSLNDRAAGILGAAEGLEKFLKYLRRQKATPAKQPELFNT